MCKEDTISIRREVINQAINYIFEHIEEDIGVEDVARPCAYSKYHLMRMFKEDMKEALYQFIKRVRIERSAWKLKVAQEKSITEIGEDYGYSASNFATAFKKHLKKSPKDYRNCSEEMVEACSFAHGQSLDESEKQESKITVEYLDSFFVLYERKKGNYHNMPEEWCAFLEKYKEFATEDTLYIDCTLEDPSIADENQCIYELCQTIPENHPMVKASKIMTHRFAGGKYAVYHFKGDPRFLFMAYQEVFCRWLPRTENHLDDRPILDIYRRVEEDFYMEIDICFPLK